MSAPTKTRASEDAARFNRVLFALADRLAAHNIVVARLRAEWTMYGSWELWLEAGAARDLYSPTILKGHRYPVPAPDVVRFTWDGRDKVLSTAVSRGQRLEPHSNWVPENTHDFSDPEDAARFVEEYASEFLRADA